MSRALSIAALCAVLGVARFAEAGDKKSYPGSFCRPNMIGEFATEYYQNFFGQYFHASTSPTVLCPILRDVTTNTDGFASIVIWVSAPGEGSVGCGVYTLDAATHAIVGQASQSVRFGAEGGVKKIDFSLPPEAIHGPNTSAEGPIGIACSLAPGFAVIGYMTEEYAAGDSE